MGARARLAVAAIVCSLSVAPTVAAAEGERIALSRQAVWLESALNVALTPWDVRVVVIDDELGGPMPRVADLARTAADAHQCGAAVWISGNGADRTVWIYDARLDEVITRPLPGTRNPGDADAAAIALSIKTLLRHSAVAPTHERFGATARHEEPASLPGAVVGVSVGTRFRTGPPREVEPRLVVSGAIWPLRFARRVGVVGRLGLGSGIAVDSTVFHGRFHDVSASAGIAAVGLRRGRFVVIPHLSGSIHFARIAGLVVAEDQDSSSYRFNPSIDAGTLVGFFVHERVHVDVELQASYHPRTQRFLVGGRPVLELEPIEFETRLGITVGLD